MKKDVKKILIISGIIIIFSFVLYGCTQDPEGLAPTKTSLVGKAFYTSSPITQNQLSQGLSLDKNWNDFIWTDEIENPVPVSEALESVEDDYYYVYDYNERKYYFNPNERYAQYNNHQYYKTRLVSELKPNHKYGIYMKNEGVLRYGTESSEKPNIIGFNQQSTREYNGEALFVSEQKSFLDITLKERGICNDSQLKIKTEIWIYVFDDSLKESEKWNQVRYREIFSGEEANFHIDMNKYVGKWVSVIMKFNTNSLSNCLKIDILNEKIEDRETHFRDSDLIKVKELASTFTTKDGKLGVNDQPGLNNGNNADFVLAEKIVLSAKEANAKYLRFDAFPELDARNCFTKDSHKCIHEEILHKWDQVYESLLDRGIIASPIVVTPMFDQQIVSSLSQQERTKFLELFSYRDSLYKSGSPYTNANGQFVWVCEKQTNPDFFRVYRFDHPDWLKYGLIDNLVSRYKNDFEVVEVLNEANLLPGHIKACSDSCSEGQECSLPSYSEWDFLKNEAKEFLSYYGQKFKNMGKTIIFGATVNWQGSSYIEVLNTQEWYESMDGIEDIYDYGSLHAYTDDSIVDITEYFAKIENDLSLQKNYLDKPFILSEFGYNHVDAISNFPEEIGNVKYFIQNNPNLHSGAYYILFERNWMSNYPPYWEAYGASALFDSTGQINEPQYSQFKGPAIPFVMLEVCNGQDDNEDGNIDEGCDDDNDGYADVNMQCPSDKSFKVFKYSDNYKRTCPTNDWCLMGSENWWSWGDGWIGLNDEVWYNYGTGWISREIPCSTNSGDRDDNNPSIH